MQHRKKRSRKRFWLLGVGLPLVLLATAAGAAWLLIAVDSGTPFTDTTGSAGTVTVTASIDNPSATDALTPGGTAAHLPMEVPNPSAQSIVFDNAPVVSVASTSGGAACPPADFTVTQGTWHDNTTQNAVTFPYTLPTSDKLDANDSSGALAPTIQMIAAAPTGCEHVTVNLVVTVTQ